MQRSDGAEADADQLVATVAKLSSASLHEAAGKLGALPASLRPVVSTNARRLFNRLDL